jgi:hypothetical protein
MRDINDTFYDDTAQVARPGRTGNTLITRVTYPGRWWLIDLHVWCFPFLAAGILSVFYFYFIFAPAFIFGSGTGRVLSLERVDTWGEGLEKQESRQDAMMHREPAQLAFR